MLEITRKISKYNFSYGNDIKYIVIHDTGNFTDSAAGNASYFGSCDRGASAHCFVDDGAIVQVVEFSNAAWHCGDGHDAYGIGNHNSIGIEMCRKNSIVTDITEANTIELVKYLMNKYGVPVDKVVRHYDASRKNCPSSFAYNNWARWFNFKAKLSGKAVAAAPVNNAIVYPTGARYNPYILDVQRIINKMGIASLTEDGKCGALTLAALSKVAVHKGANNALVVWIQKMLNINADGVFGSQTYNAVVNYQKAKGLIADGIVGKNSILKMCGYN